MTEDERLLASASLDGTVRVWDRTSGKCLRTLATDPDYQAVFLLNTGQVVASGSSLNCRLWSTSSGTLLKLFSANRLCIGASSATLALGTELGEVTLVDPQSGSILGKVALFAKSIHALEFSRDGAQVLAAGSGAVARIDVARMTVDWISEGHDPDVSISKLLIDNGLNVAVSCSHDGTARVWELETGKRIAALQHSGGVSGGAISPDGKWLFTHGAKNLLWETKTWTIRNKLGGGAGFVVKSRFSPDGKWIVMVGADGYTRICNVETGQPAETLSLNSMRVLDLLLCQGGDQIITCGDDPECRIWSRVP